MSKTPSKVVALVVAFVLTGTAAYWYWSPVLALRAMRAAAEASDADTVNNYIDYPRVRESVKGQVSARLTAGVVGSRESSGTPESIGTAIGTMLGLALVDRMADAMVRPEMVMQMMRRGKAQEVDDRNVAEARRIIAAESANGGEVDLSRSNVKPAESEASKANAIVWTTERKGADKLLVHLKYKQAPSKVLLTLVMERSGFANWRLTEIRPDLDD